MCNGFINQSRVGRPRNGRNRRNSHHHSPSSSQTVVCYVDESHACLKKDQIDEFHQHLNPINANICIQFTLELENANGQGLPFLDTITTRCGTAVQVDVYRKPIHTDRYLDFHSHHLSCHKRSLVNTLLLRARNIPSTSHNEPDALSNQKLPWDPAEIHVFKTRISA